MPTKGETAARARLQIQRLLTASGKVTGREVFTVDAAVADLERYATESRGDAISERPELPARLDQAGELDSAFGRGEQLARLLVQMREEAASMNAGEYTVTLTDRRLRGHDLSAKVLVVGTTMRLDLRPIQKPVPVRNKRPRGSRPAPADGGQHAR